MKSRRIITALSAGAALAVATGCTRAEPQGPMENPPPPVVLVPEPTGNPPPPAEPSLPTWQQAVNPTPTGDGSAAQIRTNPPSPRLLVQPNGRCFVDWIDPRRDSSDVVVVPGAPDLSRAGTFPEQGAQAMGTEIQCPERAQALLDAWKATQR